MSQPVSSGAQPSKDHGTTAGTHLTGAVASAATATLEVATLPVAALAIIAAPTVLAMQHLSNSPT